MTNAQKIRAMTDEQFAHFLEALPDACPPMGTLCSGKNCYDCWLDWLKQEIQSTPQNAPLCPACAHANMSVTDDFADCLCAKSGDYEGGRTECKDYAPREVSDNG